MCRSCIRVGVVLLGLLAASYGSASGQESRPQVLASYGRLPLHFEANHGQTDERVKFTARSLGSSVFLTATEAVWVWQQAEASELAQRPEPPGLPRGQPGGQSGAGTAKPGATALRITLAGAHPAPQAQGMEELPGKVNYFLGHDPTRWHTAIPTYARVHFQAVWPGVDVRYYGTQEQLGLDFVVAPGGNPESIQLHFAGGDGAAIDAQGDLTLMAMGREVRLRQPVIYQEVAGGRQEVTSRYILTGPHQVGLQVDAYDMSRVLVIEPVLVYSARLGDSDDDYGHGIAVDAAGSAYVTGWSHTFPIIPLENSPSNAPQSSSRSDAFVMKLDPTGSALVYATYLGGNSLDYGNGIAVDAAGHAYVTGITYSDDFPTVNPLQSALGSDCAGFPCPDAFIAKLHPTGAALVYSTYFGGAGNDLGTGIAVDAAGHAYVTGWTASVNFPTTPGVFQPIHGGFSDAFVTQLNATGSALVYSTYLGGRGNDKGGGIAVDRAGNAYVTGWTESTNFPTTPGAFQPVNGGYADAFVTQLNATGAALVYSTYLGGGGNDSGGGIVVDGGGRASVTGRTSSLNFPTTPGALQPEYGGGFGGDAFVARLNATGAALAYATYLGGSSQDSGNGIAVDDAGNVYVTGWTESSNFPTTPGAFLRRGGNAFVSKLYPVIVPELALGVNYPAFRPGEPLILSAMAAPGSSPVTADVYIAIRLPDGTLLFLQGDGNFTPAIQPIVRSWLISPFNGHIFTYTFGGAEPVGSYTWLGAFTEPGTLNIMGEIAQASFTFSP